MRIAPLTFVAIAIGCSGYGPSRAGCRDGYVRTASARASGGGIGWSSIDGKRHGMPASDPCVTTATYSNEATLSEVHVDCREGADHASIVVKGSWNTQAWKFGKNALGGAAVTFVIGHDCSSGDCPVCTSGLIADVTVDLHAIRSAIDPTNATVDPSYVRAFWFDVKPHALADPLGACPPNSAWLPEVSIDFLQQASDFHVVDTKCVPTIAE